MAGLTLLLTGGLGNVAVEIFRLDRFGCAPLCSKAPAYICTHFLCVSNSGSVEIRWMIRKGTAKELGSNLGFLAGSSIDGSGE